MNEKKTVDVGYSTDFISTWVECPVCGIKTVVHNTDGKCPITECLRCGTKFNIKENNNENIC